MGNEIPKLQLHTQYDYQFIKVNLLKRLERVFQDFLYPLEFKPNELSSRVLSKKQIKIVKLLTEKCFEHVLNQTKLNCQIQGVDFNKAINDNKIEVENLDHDLLAEVQELMDENDELTLEVTRLRQKYPEAYSKLFLNQSISTLNLFGFNFDEAYIEELVNYMSELEEINENQLYIINNIFKKLNPLSNKLKDLVTKSEHLSKVVQNEHNKRIPKLGNKFKRLRRYSDLEKPLSDDEETEEPNINEDESLLDEEKLRKSKLFRVNFKVLSNPPSNE